MKTILDFALERQKKRIIEAAKLGEEVYFLSDIESGVPYEVSKEYYNMYHAFVKSAAPTFDGDKVGSVVVMGTGGCTNALNEIRESWFGKEFPKLHIYPEQKKKFIKFAKNYFRCSVDPVGHKESYPDSVMALSMAIAAAKEIEIKPNEIEAAQIDWSFTDVIKNIHNYFDSDERHDFIERDDLKPETEIFFA